MKKISIICMLSGLMSMFIACGNNQQTPSETNENKTAGDQQATENNQLTEERLRRFDSLDFNFYNNQQWESFAISHDANIKCYYPDGTTTTGLFPQHIDMLKPCLYLLLIQKLLNIL